MGTYNFKTELGQQIFREKYADGPDDDWPILARRVVNGVCGKRNNVDHPLMNKGDISELTRMVTEMKFIPGGRYLAYAGKPLAFWNNCFALKCEEDSREEWANIVWRSVSCLMSGGGIGVDYSIIRPSGYRLNRTGGIASGPLALMQMINDAGKGIMQGGNRRSAIWAGLHSEHEDILKFVHAKANDFGYLDHTNLSVIFDEDHPIDVDSNSEVWKQSVLQMCMTGEPGHSYNFGENYGETLRNACTEFTSDRDSDVCNLGSINLSNIDSISEFKDVVELSSKFLVCGSLRADLPYRKVEEVRSEYRKIGLGLMGVHEWLLKRGYSYEANEEFEQWLLVYKSESERAAREHAERFYVATPRKFRAIAPAGTIGILAGTTQGIEPIYSTAYKRRYFSEGKEWKTQYIIEPVAAYLVRNGFTEDEIETAFSLSRNVEKRIKFQAVVQQYVDMGISSTINLPEWGSNENNLDKVEELSDLLYNYCGSLRGITVYPNGTRGGQPIEPVTIEEAGKHHGIIYTDEESCVGGICGI